MGDAIGLKDNRKKIVRNKRKGLKVKEKCTKYRKDRSCYFGILLI